MYCLSPPMSEPPEGMYNNNNNNMYKRVTIKGCCIPELFKVFRFRIYEFSDTYFFMLHSPEQTHLIVLFGTELHNCLYCRWGDNHSDESETCCENSQIIRHCFSGCAKIT